MDRADTNIRSALAHYTAEDDEYQGFHIPKGSVVIGVCDLYYALFRFIVMLNTHTLCLCRTCGTFAVLGYLFFI